MDGVDFNAVDARAFAKRGGFPKGVDDFFDFFFGKRAGFNCRIPDVGHIGGGACKDAFDIHPEQFGKSF